MTCWIAVESLARIPPDSPHDGFAGLDFRVAGGGCLALDGSPAAVSAALRVMAGDERPDQGRVSLSHGGTAVEITATAPWRLIEARRITLGYVEPGQRLMPRLSAIELVMDPALRAGRCSAVAGDTARRLLAALGVPDPLWLRPLARLAPVWRQRVAVARGFAVDYPVLLLDDPFHEQDPDGCARVARLVRQAARRGSAVVLGGAEAAALADRVVSVAVLPSSSAKRRAANFAPEESGEICYQNRS